MIDKVLSILSDQIWQNFATLAQHIGHFQSFHLVFAKILSLFWQNCFAIGQNFIVVNSQKVNKSSSYLVTLKQSNHLVTLLGIPTAPCFVREKKNS